MGDYEVVSPEGGVSSNSLISPVKQVPLMHSDAFGSIRVSHREFLSDLSGSNTTAQRYPYVLNPGDARTFPWLSNLAEAFSQWKLLGMAFEFRSTCGDAVSSTNSALGSVSFATQYNVLEPVFGAKTQILNHFWSGSAKPSVDQLHLVECEPNVTPTAPLYIRNRHANGTLFGDSSVGPHMVNRDGSVLDTTFEEMYDARLYDHGRTEVFILGQQAAFVVGELWITYDVLLMKPRRPDPRTLTTYDPPNSLAVEPVLLYTHRPEVPLSAVVSIDQTAFYPADALIDVDEKTDV